MKKLGLNWTKTSYMFFIFSRKSVDFCENIAYSYDQNCCLKLNTGSIFN